MPVEVTGAKPLYTIKSEIKQGPFGGFQYKLWIEEDPDCAPITGTAPTRERAERVIRESVHDYNRYHLNRIKPINGGEEMPIGVESISVKAKIWKDRPDGWVNWEIRDGSHVNARIAGGGVNNRQAARNKIMGHVKLMEGRYGCTVKVDLESSLLPDVSDLEKVRENAVEMAGAQGAHIEEATETILALCAEVEKWKKLVKNRDTVLVQRAARNLFLSRSQRNTLEEWEKLPVQATDAWHKEARRVLEIEQPRVLKDGETTPARHLPVSVLRRG